jgi:uncharacterized membrane protein YdjX (TVP38/TMEM64 family)
MTGGRICLKNKKLKLLIVIAIIIAVLGLVYLAFVKMMPDLIPVLEKGNEVEIEDYLRSSNSFIGLIALALLQFLQVISILIPGAPIQIAAGIVYGVVKGFFICHISYTLSNLTVFLFARKFGSSMSEKGPVDVSKKLAKFNLFINGRSPAYITMLACLIPLMPNGIIPYAAARTRICTKNFTLAVYVGSFIPIFVMCSIGSRILQGDFLFATLIFAAFITLVVILYRLRDTILDIMLEILNRHNQKKDKNNDQLKTR